VTPLALELLRILESERDYPPLSAASLVKVLHAVGYGDRRLEESIVQGGLEELMAAGQVERLHSARLGARYRAMPRPAGVAASGTDRPLP
jgi:hypothetical protein